MTTNSWWNWLYVCFVILITGTSPSSPNLSSPSILTKSQKFHLPKGETAKMHCKVRNAGSLPLVWRRGFNVLATGSVLVSPDPRLSVSDQGDRSSLVISGVTEEDAGEYVCQLSTLEGIISVQHSLDIMVSPSISVVPPGGTTSVGEGEDAILQCEVGGNPLPTVTWTKQGGSLPSHAHPVCPNGGCLSLPSVSRSDSGVYTCSASNGVGEPAVASLKFEVMFPPVIRVENEQVQSGLGSKLILTCDVEGEPTPSLSWYFGENQVRASPGTGLTLSQSDRRHSLTVARSDRGTFGNYSCVASNSLGTFKKHIEVHGRPTEATFQRVGMVSSKTSFELSWKVRSFVKIHEYRLLYRSVATTGSKIHAGSSDWTNVIIPGTEAFTAGLQITRWRLDNLEEDSTYECLVQARNDYGWSHPSKMFTFSTSEKGFQSPATSGLNWGGPLTGASSGRSMISFLLHLIVAAMCWG